MIPKYHTVEYKTHKIYYVCGMYRIDKNNFFYISIDDAKKEVDRIEQEREEFLVKFFDNLNNLNETN